MRVCAANNQIVLAQASSPNSTPLQYIFRNSSTVHGLISIQCLSRSHSSSSHSCSLSRMQRSDQFLLKMTSNPVYLSLSTLRRSQSTQKGESVPPPEDTPLLSNCFSEFPLSPRSMYIIYTPNLGLWIAVSVREREQGRFRGKQGGSKGRVTREH